MKAFFTNIHLPVIRGAASSTLLAHETPVAAAAHKTAIPFNVWDILTCIILKQVFRSPAVCG